MSNCRSVCDWPGGARSAGASESVPALIRLIPQQFLRAVPCGWPEPDIAWTACERHAQGWSIASETTWSGHRQATLSGCTNDNRLSDGDVTPCRYAQADADTCRFWNSACLRRWVLCGGPDRGQP